MVPPDSPEVLDNCSAIQELQSKARAQGVFVHALGAMTAELAGTAPADMLALQQAGAIAVSNARADMANDDVLLRALEYAANFAIPVFFYPNESALAKAGVAHDGFIATYQGLPAIASVAETAAIAKQLLLIKHTNVRAHFSQLSCQNSVQLIREAKTEGLNVTCDVAMHQLHLTENALIGFDTNAYVLPPLRSEQDRQALLAGLQDGTIDAICSHHTPLSLRDKFAPFAEAIPGISAFDTFMALGCKLVADGVLSAEQLVAKIATNPASIAGIDALWQSTGGAIVVDPNKTWQVTKDTLLSQGKNTPFLGERLQGKVVAVFFD